jgi:LPS export ABC transporter protein LptC
MQRKVPYRVKRIRIALGVIIVSIVATLAVIYTHYRRTVLGSAPIIADIKPDGKISIERIQQSATKEGKTQWSLDARSVSYDHEKHRAIFEEPAVTFFLEDGDFMLMNARRGILDTGNNDISAEGDVKLQKEEDRLETQRLEYRHAQRRIDVPGALVITGRAFSLSADAMAADLNSSQITFKGKVTGIFDEKAK